MALPVWLIVAFVMFVVMIILFKTMNQVYLLSLVKKHFFNFFIIAIFIMLAISLVHIHNSYDINLATYEGITEAGKIYIVWLGNVASNFGKITGFATQQDWLTATNSTG